VAGLVGGLLQAIGYREEEEYIDIDTPEAGKPGWPYSQVGALLALLCGAFRVDPDLGRRVLQAALRAYTEDLCSSLRAEAGGGEGAGDAFLGVLIPPPSPRPQKAEEG